MDYRKNYQTWLSDPRLSEEGRAELKAIASDEKAKEYQIRRRIGIRNGGHARHYRLRHEYDERLYRHARDTRARGVYQRAGAEAVKRGVVISYDTRRKSDVFAKAAAGVLAKNGIKAYLFDDVHPVPMLSFAVRYLHTVAGIMITASHNPKEYNGYKVYGADGAQMSPEDTEK